MKRVVVESMRLMPNGRLLIVPGCAYAVELAGGEGIASRFKAPCYKVVHMKSGTSVTVKRHMFGNQPFYVVQARDGEKVTVEQGMAANQIVYRVYGSGYSYTGGFGMGKIEILKEGRPLVDLRADVESDGSLGLSLSVLSEGFGMVALGTCAACALLMGYTRGIRMMCKVSGC